MIVISFEMVMLLSKFRKRNCYKSWRTLVQVDISLTFCLVELMSGRTIVLTPIKLLKLSCFQCVDDTNSWIASWLVDHVLLKQANILVYHPRESKSGSNILDWVGMVGGCGGLLYSDNRASLSLT